MMCDKTDHNYSYRMNVTFVFIILLATSFVTAKQDSGVFTFGLHTKVEPSEPDGRMETEMVFPNGTEEISACLDMKIIYRNSEVSIVMAFIMSTLKSITLLFTAKNKILLVVDDKPFPSYFQFVPRKWLHICVIVGSKVSIYVDGNSILDDSLGMEYSELFGESGRITLGIPTNFNSIPGLTTLGGYYTLPQVFPRVLGDEVKKLAMGEEIPGNLLVESKWNVFCKGDIKVTTVSFNKTKVNVAPFNKTGDDSCFDVQLEDPSQLSLPRPLFDFVFISVFLNYSHAEHLCNNLGGVIPTLEDVPHLESVETNVKKTTNDSRHFRIWLKRSNEEFCPYYVSATISRRNCEASLILQCCKIARNKIFRIYGFPTHIIRDFPGQGNFYLSSTLPNLRFVSKEGYEIRISDSNQDDLKLDLVKYPSEKFMASATLDDLFIVGRRNWKVTGRKSSKPIQMALTKCSKNEFTCNDGTCLQLSKRCDGEIDCFDGSDEGCQILRPLPTTYNQARPYQKMTPVGLELRIKNILSVDVAENLIYLHLRITTTWRDDRVTLLHLHDNKHFNPIPNESIWYPKYFFPEGTFKDNIAISTKKDVRYSLRSQKVGEGRIEVRDTFEGYEYSGSKDSFFILTEEFVASFSCEYTLNMYPFDRHICPVHLEILQDGEFFPYLNKSAIRVDGDNLTLPLFETKPPVYHKIDDGNVFPSDITAQIYLQRRNGAYCFTTLLPCIMLGAIGTFTQFFDAENFSDRIMVTLSCLIVVASLFSQVAVTAPISADPKAIDVFFFYCIVRLLYIFLHHCLLQWVHGYVLKREARNNQKKKSRKASDRVVADDLSDAGIQERKKMAGITQGSLYTKNIVKVSPSPAWYLAQRYNNGSSNTPRKCYLPLYKTFNLIGIVLLIICDIIGFFLYYVHVNMVNDAILGEFKEHLSNSE